MVVTHTRKGIQDLALFAGDSASAFAAQGKPRSALLPDAAGDEGRIDGTHPKRKLNNHEGQGIIALPGYLADKHTGAFEGSHHGTEYRV